MSEKKDTYERGKTYLVKSLGSSVCKHKFLESTKTSYKIQNENGTTFWIEKYRYESEYRFVEELESRFGVTGFLIGKP